MRASPRSKTRLIGLRAGASGGGRASSERDARSRGALAFIRPARCGLWVGEMPWLEVEGASAEGGSSLARRDWRLGCRAAASRRLCPWDRPAFCRTSCGEGRRERRRRRRGGVSLAHADVGTPGGHGLSLCRSLYKAIGNKGYGATSEQANSYRSGLRGRSPHRGQSRGCNMGVGGGCDAMRAQSQAYFPWAIIVACQTSGRALCEQSGIGTWPVPVGDRDEKNRITQGRVGGKKLALDNMKVG
jgi:hypothetical protein